MPTLAPGTPWSGEITLSLPKADDSLAIALVRPTGFSVTERSCNTQGKLISSA